MDKLNYTQYKIGILVIKYIPIIMFIIMWIHVGLLLIGVNGPFADTIAGSAIIPSILIFSMSTLFKFCYLHKALTIYSLAVDLCINYQRYIGFGDMLHISRLIMFYIGIVLFILLLFKFNKYKYKCCILRD